MSRRSAALFRALAPLLGLAAVWMLFAVLAPGAFLTWSNHRLMLLQTAVVGTAAVGATLIIISRGIDLSVGSTIALCTMATALLHNAGAPAWVVAVGTIGAAAGIGAAIGGMVVGRVGHVAAVGLALAVGWWLWPRTLPAGALPLRVMVVGAGAAGVGAGGVALSAWLIRRLELSPFIVTLGMWGALRGLAKGLGDNQPVYPDTPGFLSGLMSGSAGGTGLPWGVWIMLALAAGMAVLLRHSVPGRQVVAIGANEAAARSCGIRVGRVRVMVYTVGIACAGVAGLMQFSFLSMGDPTTAEGYELKVIAAAVIGGASLAGGEGTILGTLVGALLMTVVDNGCTKLGMANWVQEVVTGAIIVAAVVVDRLRRRGE